MTSAPASASRSPVTVVLPTRDRVDHLAVALPAVVAALGAGDELIVVDSASTDPQVAAVAAEYATVVRCDSPGVDRARNAGWRRATNDLVLFVDDDVVVDLEWASAMARCFDRHPDAAFVTGRIEVPAHQVGAERPVAVKDDREPAVLDRTTTGVLGHSASLGVRRDVLEAVGGFDESLGAGGRFRSAPEVDLFDRILATGRTGRYEPAARAWHDQWRTHRDHLALDWRYGVGTGARLAKLVRTDRSRARIVAADGLWRNGVRGAAHDVRTGYERAAALKAVHVAGIAWGFVRAAAVPLDDGHFRGGS